MTVSPCAIRASAVFFPSAQASLISSLPAPPLAERSGQLARMDRLSGLALCAADLLLTASAIADRLPRERTAVLLGTSYGCHKTDEEFLRGVFHDQPSPRLFAYTLPSSPIGEVSIHHRLLGPGLCLIGGRSAGLEALCEAQSLLLSGQAEACVVLGCEVAAPLFTETKADQALTDAAVAILLTRETVPAAGGYLLGNETAFCENDPQSALTQALAAISRRLPTTPTQRLIGDSSTRDLLSSSISALMIYDTPPCGAAAPLAVLAALPTLALREKDASEVWLVCSADASGQAAVAAWALEVV